MMIPKTKREAPACLNFWKTSLEWKFPMREGTLISTSSCCILIWKKKTHHDSFLRKKINVLNFYVCIPDFYI